MVVERASLPRALNGTRLVSAPDVVQQFAGAITRRGRYMQRGLAEGQSDYVQPIPLTYVQTGSRLLVLPGDDRDPDDHLYRRPALWVGGHIDEADACETDPIAACLRRELKEELGLAVPYPPELVGLVIDEDDRPSLHVGLVHRLAVDAPDLDQAEIRRCEGMEDNRPDGSVDFGRALRRPIDDSGKTAFRAKLVELDVLRADISRLEPWSRLILTEVLTALQGP